MVDAGKSFGTASRSRKSERKPPRTKSSAPWPIVGTRELLRAMPPPAKYRKWVHVHVGPFSMPFPTLLAGKQYARDHGTVERPAVVRGGWPAETLFVYPERPATVRKVTRCHS